MVLVPFIYFTILTLYWWKKHKGVDICVYMSALYAFTSLCATIIVFLGLIDEGGILFDEMDIELNLIPTIVFIILLTLSILPFSLIYAKEIRTIQDYSPFFLNMLCWLLIGLSFLNLYLVADSTLDILGGDLEAVRAAHYEGILSPAQLKAEKMPAIFRYLYYLNTCTLLALPLFFYYICTPNRKKWWFKLLLLFSSFSVPISGIQAADRTEIMFYFLMLIYCFVFFQKMISKRFWRYTFIFGTPIILLAIVYLAAVTQARFEDRGSGPLASATEYAGQGYLNFCFFWERQNTDEIATEREFPLINHVLLGIDSNPIRRDERSGKQGFFISVFPTFAGDLLLDLGFAGASIWVCYFFLIGMLIIKSAHREAFYVGEMLLIFVMAGIPLFGIFYYKYFSFPCTLTIIIALCIYLLSSKQFRLS